MLHDQSLEELIRQKLTETISDPLSYKDMYFDMSEWFNIPSLVPQYLLHINNHLKALIGYCKNKSLEETSDALRKDVF